MANSLAPHADCCGGGNAPGIRRREEVNEEVFGRRLDSDPGNLGEGGRVRGALSRWEGVGKGVGM